MLMLERNLDIKDIYRNIANKYDLMSRHLNKYRKHAIEKSQVKKGDRVLVFCCGTGLDFYSIEERIGGKGHITGVDFSENMIAVARRRCYEMGWFNVDLVCEDVGKFECESPDSELFDVGICTLGLSIIPDYQSAFLRLLSLVRKGGEIIIGDIQLAPSVPTFINAVSVILSRPFGGTWKGHLNARRVYELMQKKVNGFRSEEYVLKSYFIAWGTKPG
jgi:demethylmenaquinone methyltransferase/2-methoxy-6-polyprenyl-1,4-benzoquinol methylase